LGYFQASAVAHTLQHEPRGFLRYAKGAMRFVRANAAVFAISGQPHSRQPLFQTNRGIFKDRPDLRGKLLFRVSRGISKPSRFEGMSPCQNYSAGNALH
jgi:hypothetical protein